MSLTSKAQETYFCFNNSLSPLTQWRYFQNSME